MGRLGADRHLIGSLKLGGNVKRSPWHPDARVQRADHNAVDPWGSHRPIVTAKV